MSLTVEIKADINNFSGNIDKAEKQVNSFANSITSDVNKINSAFDKINGKSIGGLNNRLAALKKNLESATDIKSISKYNIRIKQTQDEIERLKNLGLQASNSTKGIGASSATNGIDNLTSSMKRSNTVAMEFNRIIQDAPFGIMGISNNLTQLTDNYKNYATQIKAAAAEQGKSVSNFQIFKGAIAGIFSPLNLFSLALSSITSGLIIYQQWQQRSSKSTKETTDKLQELVDGLGNVSSVLYKSAQAYGQEVSQLRSLYEISQDVTQSTDSRRKAANDLIDQYPALFGKFSQEQIMLGKAKVAYQEVSKAIVSAARAQAAFGMIGEKSASQLAIDETNRSLQKQLSILDQTIQRQESLTSVGRGVGGVAESIESSNVSKLNRLYDDRSKLVKQVTDNLLERATLQEQINELESFAITNQANAINLDEEKNESTNKNVKSLSEYRSELTELIASWGIYESKIESLNIKFNEASALAKKAGASLAEFQTIASRQWVEKAEVQLSKLSKSLSATTNVTLSGTLNMPESLPYLDDAEKRLEAQMGSFNDSAKSLTLDFSNAIGAGVSDIFSSVGESIANGTNIVDAIGGSLISSLGGLAKSIGEQMIAFGTAGIALKSLMNNPYLALAAGAALVALGSFATSSVGRQTSSFNGTSVGTPSSSLTNTDIFQRGAYYNNEQQVVKFQISGNNLEGVMNVQGSRNTRLG